jgi:hypothetical protein
MSIGIEWIEKSFINTHSQQSRRSTSTNGKPSIVFWLSMWLEALKAWNYTIWPITVTAWTGATSSESIDIKITWERLMVNPRVNSALNKQFSPPTVPTSSGDIDSADLSSRSHLEVFVPKKIIWLDGKEMTDIYPSKGILYGEIISKDSLKILLLLLTLIPAFFLITYLLWFLQKRVEWSWENKNITPLIKTSVPNYTELIAQLKAQQYEDSEEAFYSHMWSIFRIYLDDRVKKWLSHWTLDEVKTFFTQRGGDDSQVFLSFYQTIYFPEYRRSWDSSSQRAQHIQQLEHIILS